MYRMTSTGKPAIKPARENIKSNNLIIEYELLVNGVTLMVF